MKRVFSIDDVDEVRIETDSERVYEDDEALAEIIIRGYVVFVLLNGYRVSVEESELFHAIKNKDARFEFICGRSKSKTYIGRISKSNFQSKAKMKKLKFQV